jgi:predicted CopG family antitoxin
VLTNIDNKNKKREYKQVRLPKEVYDKLVVLGTAGNSIADVIASLIREHEANEGSKKEILYVYEGLCP